MQAPTAQHSHAGRERRPLRACARRGPDGLGAPVHGSGALVVGIVKVPLPGAPNSTLAPTRGRGCPVGVSRAPAFAFELAEGCA